LDEKVDLTFVVELYFVLLWVYVDVDTLWIDRDEQHEHRMLASVEQVFVC
jgi:hypothetical protein